MPVRLDRLGYFGKNLDLKRTKTMSKAIKFEDRNRGVFSAFIERTFEARGKTWKGFGAVRVKCEGDHYRIDRTDAVAGAWMPWEAIDSVEYPTQAKAMAAVRKWAKANRAHGAPAPE